MGNVLPIIGDMSEETSKPWWQSSTIVAGIVGGAVTLSAAVFGIQIEDLQDAIVQGVLAMGAFASTVGILIGRFRAGKQVK